MAQEGIDASCIRGGAGPLRSDFVVCVDIDGTLGQYHEHFHAFAEAWTGRTLPEPKLWKGDTIQSFWSYLGMSRQTYRKVKLAYRQGGLKRSMPTYDSGMTASEFTYRVRYAHLELWLCTTRPYLQLGNIDEDTRHWCRRNKIRYDQIMWGEKKYQDAVREARRHGQKVIVVLDDDPLLVAQGFQARGRVMDHSGEFIMDRPWNRLSAWPRCFTFNEALTAIAEAVKNEH
jgi:hypothetical protein